MHLGIRADGGPDIGYGHLVRTGALASEVLGNGGRVTYVSETPTQVREVCPTGIELRKLSDTSTVSSVKNDIDELDLDALLTDSYEIDLERQRAFSDVVRPFAVVLDDTRHRLSCDHLVNGNVYAPSLEYEWEGNRPTFCLGPKYLLMRSAFAHLREMDPPWRDPPEHAIVLMGGSDINNATPTVLRSFRGSDMTVSVIVGPGFRNRDEIRRTADEVDVTVDIVVDPDDLPQRMFGADIAISATGSTVYELLATGTPTIGIPQADNQEPIATALADRDALLHCERLTVTALSDALEYLVANSDYRRTLRRSGRQIIDCKGPKRVCRYLADMVP